MGAVYAIERDGCSGELAMKVLGAGGSLAMFYREADILGAIRSDRVPRVRKFVEVDRGTPAIVMDKVGTESLEAYLHRTGPLDPFAVVDLVGQVADALDDVHASGVVHADVKPDNIVLRSVEGRLFASLVDFGVARRLDDTGRLDEDASPSGTPSSMAPEQMMRPDEPRISWDVWGLAVLAYECFTGRVPHEGSTLAAALLSTQNGSRPSIAQRRDDVGPTVDQLFDRAFARSPGARFATPRALVAQLEEIVFAIPLTRRRRRTTRSTSTASRHAAWTHAAA